MQQSKCDEKDRKYRNQMFGMEEELKVWETKFSDLSDSKDRLENQIKTAKTGRLTCDKERIHMLTQFDLCVANYDKIKTQIVDSR